MTDFNAKDYWETRLNKDFSLHGVGYIGHGEEYNRWMYKVRSVVFHRVFKVIRLNRKNSKVLDIGSGTGFYISLWNKTGVQKVDGADITKVAVDNLRQNFPSNEFHQLDISSISNEFLNTHRYNIISVFDVLFHIVDDELFLQALKNIHSLLENEGYFVFSDNFIHQPTFRSQHHVSRNIAEIYKALDTAGFKVIYRKPAFVFMNAPVDSAGRFIPWVWKMQEKLIYRNRKYGKILGFLFYPFELLFTRIKSEGPSTEVVICVKK